MQQISETRTFISTCCFSHAQQPERHSHPALRPGSGRLLCVPLSQPPSLHDLRQRFRRAALVRPLRWYYAVVRLPTDVHGSLSVCSLGCPARRTIFAGRPWDLLVPAPRISTHTQVLGPRRAQVELAPWRSIRCGLPLSSNSVGALDNWFSQLNDPVCVFFCLRFMAHLTVGLARLEAEVGRYSFLVRNFHPLSLDGFASAPNLPRSVFTNRDSFPLAFISRKIAE